MVFVIETCVGSQVAPLTSTVAPQYELLGYPLTEAEVQPSNSTAIIGHLSDWAPHRLVVSFWSPSTLKLGQQGSSKKHFLRSQPRVDRHLVMDLPST